MPYPPNLYSEKEGEVGTPILGMCHEDGVREFKGNAGDLAASMAFYLMSVRLLPHFPRPVVRMPVWVLVCIAAISLAHDLHVRRIVSQSNIAPNIQ